MTVAPALVTDEVAGIFPVDIEAAEKGFVPIDDQQLAVIAPVIAQGLTPAPAMEPAHLYVFLLQDPDQAMGTQKQRTRGVDMQLHRHAMTGAVDQGAGEASADFVVGEYIGFKTHPLGGGGDRRQHALVQFIAVKKQVELVGRGCRQTRDPETQSPALLPAADTIGRHAERHVTYASVT